jgi:hypothetical protein
MPNISRAHRRWDQLSPQLRRSLLWLNAGTLLRSRDLLDLAWPEAHADRRNARKRLREWAADRLIVVDATSEGAAVRLGPLGATKLREAKVVETVRLLEAALAERVLAGVLRANQLGVCLALCGPLRMERSYDARFATSLTDPGRPDWTTKLEVITMLPVDEATPDGSFVELIGVVEGEPRVRREMVGASASEPFASVRQRCRRQLRSGIARSRAVFSSSTVLTLHVPLSGDLAHAGALLRDGNTVHVHGRLVQYRCCSPCTRALSPC